MKYLVSLTCSFFLWVNFSPTAIAQTSQALIADLRNNVVHLTVHFVENKKEGFGFITGERRGDIYVVVPSTLVYEQDADPGQNFPLRLSALFLNGHSETDCTVEDVDNMNGIARLRIKKPDGLVWEPACLAIAVEINTPVAAIGSLGLKPNWNYPQLDTLTASVSRVNYLDIGVRTTARQPGVTGAALINEEGFLGIIIQSQGQEQIVRQTAVIREFMSEGGRLSYAYQLVVSEYARKKHNTFKVEKIPRGFFELRAGYVFSLQDIDDLPQITINRNGLGPAIGLHFGVRWPANWVVGIETRFYNGAYAITIPATGFHTYNSKAISAVANIGYEWVKRRWQIIPSLAFGTILFRGQLIKSCRRGSPDNCVDVNRSLDNNGFAFGAGLSNYLSISQNVRLGLTANYQLFTNVFPENGIGIFLSGEYSFPINKVEKTTP